jgi:hypothetical protein
MPDLSQLLNAPAPSTGARSSMNVLRGVIRHAPTSANDWVEAVSQGYTAQAAYEIPPSNWALMGPLPVLNETCLIAIDDTGDAYLVLYAGASASSSGGTTTGGGAYSAAFGDGAATSFVIAHSLNTRNVLVGAYRSVAPYDEVVCDVEHTSLNSVTLRVASAPSPSQYTAVVLAGGGTGGADKNYVHTQGSPAATWSVAHGLAKFPAVDVVDTGGSVVIPTVLYVDANNVTLSFGSPTTGKAYVN